jgi:shikimate dehydrogenase
MHEREAERLGLRYLYMPIDLDQLDLPPDYLVGMIKYARLLGFRGLNVTHPCKQAVLEHLDDVAPEAAAIGAVNSVVFRSGRAVGHNTDAYGFEQSLLRGLPGASLERVVVLGAGGAGSAVAHTLLGLDARQVVVVDPDESRLEKLVESLRRRFHFARFAVAAPDDLPRCLGDATGMVNATPVGMAAHPGMPLAAALLRGDLWVADIVYLPLETALLRAARQVGCRTLDGGGMAVFQAAAAFELFTGLSPDSVRMLEHFAELARVSRKGV